MVHYNYIHILTFGAGLNHILTNALFFGLVFYIFDTAAFLHLLTEL